MDNIQTVREGLVLTKCTLPECAVLRPQRLRVGWGKPDGISVVSVHKRETTRDEKAATL